MFPKRVIIENNRPPDHEDERRALHTVFNGEGFGGEDFKAKHVSALSDVEMRWQPQRGRSVIFAAAGTLTIECGTHTRTIDPGGRAILPPRLSVVLKVPKEVIAIVCTEFPLRGNSSVKASEGAELLLSDGALLQRDPWRANRRILFDLTGHPRGMKPASQVKTLNARQTAMLGGHYHYYAECYAVLRGHACWRFEDPNNADVWLEFTQEVGDYVRIPPHTAHACQVSSTCILLGATELPYNTASENDTPVKMAPIESRFEGGAYTRPPDGMFRVIGGDIKQATGLTGGPESWIVADVDTLKEAASIQRDSPMGLWRAIYTDSNERVKKERR